MDKKKMNVLIISNNCISNGGAAGRTIKNLFDGSVDYELHQFYISGEIPDSDDVCRDYFCITDREIMKAYPFYRDVGCRIKANPTQKQQRTSPGGAIKKTVLSSMMRNCLWNMGAWKSKSFLAWLDEISPDVIFFLNSDAEFLLKIVLYINERYNCPIVMYNTEQYYFCESCFMFHSKWSRCLYPLWKRNYRKVYNRLMNKVDCAVYNSTMLKEQYAKEFDNPSCVIYASTTVRPKQKNTINNPPRFVYMGNLGLNRDISLIELGKVIKKVNPDATLDIYGNAKQQSIIDRLNQSPYVSYNGVITYEKVVQKMYEYDFLVHAESFEKAYIDDVKFGFSTKIPDCIASGTCLVAYADASIAFVEYLKSNEAACVISRPAEAENAIAEVINDVGKRNRIIKNAIAASEKNHCSLVNAKKIYEILRHVTETSK